MAVMNFEWDDLEDNIVAEYDDAGNTLVHYTTEPALYGNLLSQNRGGVESHYHYDAQGSTLALTDDSQQVTDTYAYTAFGEVTERTGNTENPFQYIGQKQYYTSAQIGDLLVRRRPYQPGIMRWLSADSYDLLTGASLWEYVDNYPTMQIDPSGLLVTECVTYDCSTTRYVRRVARCVIANRNLVFIEDAPCPRWSAEFCCKRFLFQLIPLSWDWVLMSSHLSNKVRLTTTCYRRTCSVIGGGGVGLVRTCPTVSTSAPPAVGGTPADVCAVAAGYIITIIPLCISSLPTVSTEVVYEEIEDEEARKRKCSCAYGWEHIDHKGERSISWEPSGKGQITIEDCVTYCKSVAGKRVLLKIRCGDEYRSF
jgi:RHS repeat-associated protein